METIVNRINEIDLSGAVQCICTVNALIDVFKLPIAKITKGTGMELSTVLAAISGKHTFDAISMTNLIKEIIIEKCQTQGDLERIISLSKEKYRRYMSSNVLV